jgi:hypothetical protein
MSMKISHASSCCGALVGHAVAALLREALLRHVLGVLHPLDLHADVLEKLRVGPEMLGEVLLHPAHAHPRDEPEPLAARHLVQQLERSVALPGISSSPPVFSLSSAPAS